MFVWGLGRACPKFVCAGWRSAGAHRAGRAAATAALAALASAGGALLLLLVGADLLAELLDEDLQLVVGEAAGPFPHLGELRILLEELPHLLEDLLALAEVLRALHLLLELLHHLLRLRIALAPDGVGVAEDLLAAVDRGVFGIAQEVHQVRHVVGDTVGEARVLGALGRESRRNLVGLVDHVPRTQGVGAPLGGAAVDVGAQLAVRAHERVAEFLRAAAELQDALGDAGPGAEHLRLDVRVVAAAERRDDVEAGDLRVGAHEHVRPRERVDA